MLRTLFEEPAEGPRRLLCLGAHCDDLEIGCGGTILRLCREWSDLEVLWVVFASNDVRRAEATACAESFLEEASRSTIEVHEFRDGFFPYVGGEIKEVFEEIKGGFSPDLILTQYRDDLHQDHRLVCELTWNTFRDHLILEYEIPKYDGDLGTPNFYVTLDEETCTQKIEKIRSHYPSQADKQWFDEETFRGLMRLRGVEANSPTRYAEAFYARKIVS